MNVNNRTVTELILTPFGYPHPYKLNFVSQYRFVFQVGEYLVRRDDHQNIIGGLAHSWDIDSNRHSITFHLRPNIYNAQEVKESLVRFLKTGQTSHSNLTTQIESEKNIEIIDELTLKIRTTGDAGAILAPLVMADMVILPDNHWIKVNGEEQIDWSKVKGPYTYVSGSFPLKEGEALVFKPNPNHYYYSNESLVWKMEYHPIEKIKDMAEFKALLDNNPSYTTIRYWDLYQIFYTLNDLKIDFYETKTNGIAFLLVNSKKGVFRDKAARVTLLKHVLNSKFNLLNSKFRAYQIAQPGLVGKMLDDELNETIKNINAQKDFEFKKPIRWLLPKGPGENSNWVSEIANASGLQNELKSGVYLDVVGAKWQDGEFDVAALSVGMSDEDPISGASFLFSPKISSADLPDGRILKLLNSAKETTDREVITNAVKNAFKMAMEEGLIIPISYVTNRHYHSQGVELNIQDPYAEGIRIWEVRLKN